LAATENRLDRLSARRSGLVSPGAVPLPQTAQSFVAPLFSYLRDRQRIGGDRLGRVAAGHALIQQVPRDIVIRVEKH
jgi:hypothetical protein